MARLLLSELLPPPAGSYVPANAIAEQEDAPAARQGSKSTIAVTILATISTLAVSALLLLFIYYYYVRQKVKKQKRSIASSSSPSSSHQANHDKHSHEKILGARGRSTAPDPRGSSWGKDNASASSGSQAFPLKLLRAATRNFSSGNVVGHGGFGSVYRGVLPDGRLVAIKQLDQGSKQGDEEFRIEVEMLTHLHSPYLVSLIGYCANQDNRLLVYEYMPNGNLQEHLHTEGTSGKPFMLDWDTRMRIALDSARALEYLHEHVVPPVIHRDFKSSNILLDSDFSAKVADFGLARLGSDEVGGLVSTRVLGTHGYVAPEYALTGHLTTKSDVYSYGVVLLELLTGRVPVDMKRPPGQGVLVSWALPRLTDRVKLVDIVDPVMAGQVAVKDLIQVAAIAAMCVQPEADYRPLMTDVVQSLVPLVKQKKGTAKVGTTRTMPDPHHHHSLVTLKSSSIDSAASNSSSDNTCSSSSNCGTEDHHQTL